MAIYRHAQPAEAVEEVGDIGESVVTKTTANVSLRPQHNPLDFKPA